MKTMSSTSQKMHNIFSLLITFIGIALLVFMIAVEGEPGAIPLALIATGIGWYFFYRRKVNS